MTDIRGQYRDSAGRIAGGKWGIDEKGIRIRVTGCIGLVEWDDIESVEVVGPDTISSRVTASRVALLGVFALAVKKSEGPGVTVFVRIKGGEEFQLHTLKLPAQTIRSWVQQMKPTVLVSESGAPTTSPAGEIPAQIAKLADLRNSGVLTDDEFAAKKAELLARM